MSNYFDNVAKELGIKSFYQKLSFEEIIKLIKRRNVTVHQSKYSKEPAHVSHNNYGEFVFFDISTKNYVVSIWGLGYHEYREQYITSFELNWANFQDEIRKQPAVSKANLIAFLEKRKKEGEAEYGKPQQSRQGVLFSMVADLTDDDTAYTELQDMEEL